MGILNWFFGETKPTQIGKLPEHLPTIKTSRVGAARSTFAGSVGGAWASDHRTESLQDTNWDHIAIATLCNQVASATTTAYHDGPKREVNQSRRKAMRAASGSANYKAQYGPDDDALQMVDPEHALMRLLKRPNPHEPGSVFRYRQVKQLRLTGTVLVWNVPSIAGPTCERYVIPVAMTTFQWPGQHSDFPFGSFKIYPNTSRSIINDDDPSSILNQDGSRSQQAGFQPGSAVWMLSMGITVDARQIQIIGYPHGWFLDDRQSPISAVALWKDADNAVNQARFSQMKNGVNTSGIWTLPPDVDADQDEMDRTQKKINDKFAGADNAGAVIVAQNGTVFTPTSENAKDMAYHEGFEQYRDACLANHGINKATVGMTDQTSQAGLVTSMRQLEYISVGPICELLSESDTFHIAPQFGEGLTVEIEPKKFNDEAERNARCQIAVSGQCITKDTLAAILDLPLLGGEEGAKLAGPPAGAKPGDPMAEGAASGPKLTEVPSTDPNKPYGGAARGETTKTLTAALDGMREADREEIEAVLEYRLKSFEAKFESTLKASDPAKPRKFSSTQINLPKELANDIIRWGKKFVPEDKLTDDGLEDLPHVTVLFGIHATNPRAVRNAVSDFGPIEITLGNVSRFECTEFDVLKIDIESEDLIALNELLSESCDNTQTHPAYVPHTTIAYVVKGSCLNLDGSEFMQGKSFTSDHVLFSGSDGIKQTLPLGKAATIESKSFTRRSVVERHLASSNGNGHSNGWHANGKAHDVSGEKRDKDGEFSGDGSPKSHVQETLYHGSHTEFDKFNDHSYLTPDSKIAGEYGKHVSSAKVNVHRVFKPHSIAEIAEESGVDPLEENRFVFEELDRKKVRDALAAKGYDAVEFEDIAPNSAGDRTHAALIVFHGHNVEKTGHQLRDGKMRLHAKSLGMSTSIGSDGGFSVPDEVATISKRVCPSCGSDDVAQSPMHPTRNVCMECGDKWAEPVPDSGELILERPESSMKHFDESKHPRGQPGNAGEFGAGNGAKKPKADQIHIDSGHIVPEGHHVDVAGAKYHPGDWIHSHQISALSGDERTAHTESLAGTKLARGFRYGDTGENLSKAHEEEVRGLKIRPDLKNVTLMKNDYGELKGYGTDSKGRRQPIYPSAHTERQAAAKFQRLPEFYENVDQIRARLQTDAESDNPKTQQCAILGTLLATSLMRIGSDRDTGAEKKAQGATTLTKNNLQISGNHVTIDFSGKSGQPNHYEVENAEIARYFQSRIDAGKERMFDVDDTAYRNYAGKILPDGFRPAHDFRLAGATSFAKDRIDKMPIPKTEHEYRESVGKVAALTAKRICDSPDVAFGSYIAPEVFGTWQANLLARGISTKGLKPSFPKETSTEGPRKSPPKKGQTGGTTRMNEKG